MRNRRTNTRKCSVRHSWVKSGSGSSKCPVCGVEKRPEYRDGKRVTAVYLPSGELFSLTGETPPCKDLSEFYQ